MDSKLKVGDVVSVLIHDANDELRIFSTTVKKVENSDFSYGCNDDWLDLGGEGQTWMRGIHPSLIPHGFMLVPMSPTDDMCSQVNSLAQDLFFNRTDEDDRNLIYRTMTTAYSVPQTQFNSHGETWGDGNAWDIKKDASK